MSEIKKVIKVEVDSKQADKNLQKTKKNVTEITQEAKVANKDFSGLGNTIDKVTGGAISGLRGTLSGVQGLTGGFKGLRGAIVATGIGALIVLLTGLVEWFRNTEKGAQTLQIVLNSIGAAVGLLAEKLSPLFEDPLQSVKDFGQAILNNIVNRFTGLLNLIPRLAKSVNKLLKGDFSGAAKEAGDAVLQIVTGVENFTDKASDFADSAIKLFNDVKNEVNASVDATRSLFEVQKRLFELQERQATQNARLRNESRLLEKQIKDTTLASEDRIKAIERLEEVELQLLNNERQRIALQKQALQAELANENNFEKQRQLRLQIANLNAEELKLQGDLEVVREKSARQLRILDEEAEKIAENERKREEERLIKAQKIQDEINKIIQDSRLEEDLDEFESLEVERQKALDELELLGGTLEQKLELEQNFLERKEALQKEFEENEILRQKAVRDLEIQLATQAVGAIAGILGEGNKIGQGLAAASALMNTYQGITAALKDPTIPSTFARIAQATAVGATGFGAVKDILSTNPNGINSAPGNTGISQQSAPRFDLAVPTNPLDDIDNTPQEVFVTSTQVSSQQSLDRNRQRNTRFN